jgi:hypothetical protein
MKSCSCSRQRQCRTEQVSIAVTLIILGEEILSSNPNRYTGVADIFGDFPPYHHYFDVEGAAEKRRRYATRRKVADSIPDEVIGFFV